MAGEGVSSPFAHARRPPSPILRRERANNTPSPPPEGSCAVKVMNRGELVGDL